jgi:hypothetical protein
MYTAYLNLDLHRMSYTHVTPFYRVEVLFTHGTTKELKVCPCVQDGCVILMCPPSAYFVLNYCVEQRVCIDRLSIIYLLFLKFTNIYNILNSIHVAAVLTCIQSIHDFTDGTHCMTISDEGLRKFRIVSAASKRV